VQVADKLGWFGDVEVEAEHAAPDGDGFHAFAFGVIKI
jgi:hypothetical protein